MGIVAMGALCFHDLFKLGMYLVHSRSCTIVKAGMFWPFMCITLLLKSSTPPYVYKNGMPTMQSYLSILTKSKYTSSMILAKSMGTFVP